MVNPYHSGPCVLGVDGGTEGVRVGLFDPNGYPLGFARASYETNYPHPGWAEQDPQSWWVALTNAVQKVLAQSQISAEAVAGISLGCTSSTVVFCDRDGTPRRPAIIWMDVRSSKQARQVLATADPALKYSGYEMVSAEWLPCKALWVLQHQPEIYHRSERVCEYTDWLGFRLTGEWAASINTASIRAYYDRAAGGWPIGLYESLGMPDLVAKLPSTVLNMGELLGPLNRSAADELGLTSGTAVAVGGADAFVGMVGLDVLSPGKAALITGSSHLQLAQSATPSYAKGLFGAYTEAVLPGQYTLEGGQISTGSVIHWFRDLSSGTYFSADAATPDSSYERLEREAALLPPGCQGVQVLDYWQGARTPHVDADARGMIWGLSLGHGPPHVYRAIIEAVCFGTETVFQTFAQHGHPVTDVVACGGAVNSDLWMQTHADVSNRAIAIPEVPEAVTLGAAVLATVSAGIHPDVASAAKRMVRIDHQIEPRANIHDAYRFYFDNYQESYGAMSELMHRTVNHENG